MYKIEITNPGHHFCNPLLGLSLMEYATREEACDAIFRAMLETIDADCGCEMVDLFNGNYWSAVSDDGRYAFDGPRPRSIVVDMVEKLRNSNEDWSVECERERYEEACRDYIMREGRASNDGVTATVEEVAD